MAKNSESVRLDESNDIAIVGMSVFCPGAKTLGAFWTNLVGGVDCISDAPPEVMEPFYFGATDNKTPDKFYCRRGGFAPHAIADPLRYGIMPVTAEGSDPDQLMSLMLAEDALYDAGIIQKNISMENAAIIIGRGNFAGLPQLRGGAVVRYSNEITRILHSALPDLPISDLEKVKKEYQNSFGRYQADTATSSIPNLPASGVANHFDMHGPAYLIDAACASGIVALEHGIGLLHSGQCDIAIIGALHADQNAVFWSAFTLMGALSYKGVIAPFSRDADGLLIGQGAGYLVIKTLRRALEDGDRIYSIVKGTAVGSDGGGHSVLVTNTVGQSNVLKSAWARAGMDPHHVGYVEGHGTGTMVGDATEVETLTHIFGDASQPTAYVGSVKSNIGHLMPAAGMMGLIKTSLALYHRRIPATLHCENPSQALSNSRFEAPQETIDWEASGLPLIAGVDAFGFGGINSHAVMTAYQEPPELQVAYRVDRRKAYSPMAYVITASSTQKLLEKLDYSQYKNQVGSFIGSPDDRYRLVVFDPSDARIQQAAEIVKRGKPWLGRADIWFTDNPLLFDGGKLVFMFPGWDSSDPVEHDSIVEELSLTWPEADTGVQESEEAERQYRKLWSDYAEQTGTEEIDLQGRSFADDIMNRTNMAQLVDEALRKTGIRADMYVGQSIGEWHAARAIGMIDDSSAMMMDQYFFDPKNTIPAELLPDLHVVAINGKLSREGRARILSIPDVWMTNDNCPSQILLCALGHSLPAIEEAAKADHVFFQPLPFASSIHTPVIYDVLDELLKQLRPITLKEGDTPLWSSETRAVVRGNQSAADAFGAQFAEPVLFRQLIGDLYERANARVFVQIGGGSLPNFVEDTLRTRPFATISSVVPGRSSVDQLRRVHALMFIMGGSADLEFMGTDPIYRSIKSIYFMPLGAPIIEDLTTLDEALKDYGPLDKAAAPAVTTGPAASVPTVTAAGASAQSSDAASAQASTTTPASPAVSPAVGTWATGPGAGAATALPAPMVPLQNVWTKGMGLPPRGFTRGYDRDLTNPLIAPASPAPVIAAQPMPAAMPSFPMTAPAPQTAAAPVPASAPVSAPPVTPAPPAAPAPAPTTPAPVSPSGPAQGVPSASVPPKPGVSPAPARAQEPSPTARPAADKPAANPEDKSVAATASRAGTRFEEPMDVDLDKYPFLEDHSIVNQPVGWANRDDLFPVIPLTMSMQLLADIAKKHAPGQRVIKIGPITAIDFIPVNNGWHGVVQGFWKAENILSLTIPGKIMMTVTMGTEAPAVPTEWVEQTEKDLGGPRMEPISRDRVYNDYAFHRERYRSLIRSEMFAQNGFLNLITKREGMGSLLDQMGQSVGLYLHLYIDHNRVSFPVRVNEITFYQDMDDQEGIFTNYCVVRNISDTFVIADMIYLRDDKVWAIARGWANQRLGIDTALWYAVDKPEENLLAEPIAENVWYAGYSGQLPNRTSMIFLYLRYLTSNEKQIVSARASEEAQNDFVAGRVALKDGVRSYLRTGDAYLYPIEIDTYYDDNGQPMVRWEDGRPIVPTLHVSVAHKDDKGVAIVGKQPVGVDIEKIEPKDQGFWDLAFTESEQELLHAQPDPDIAAIQFWVAKEAYGKMLGTGLSGDPRHIVVTGIDGDELMVEDARIVTQERDGHMIGWTA